MVNTALGVHPSQIQGQSGAHASHIPGHSGMVGWHDSRPPGYEYGQEFAHYWNGRGGYAGRYHAKAARKSRWSRRHIAAGASQIYGLVLPFQPGFAGKQHDACCDSCEQGGSCCGDEYAGCG